jgi:hypothetical protein
MEPAKSDLMSWSKEVAINSNINIAMTFGALTTTRRKVVETHHRSQPFDWGDRNSKTRVDGPDRSRDEGSNHDT